jgi:hypothetical protein
MIRHSVLFRLHRPLGDTSLAPFLAALEAFAADPPGGTGAVVRRALGLRGESPRAADAQLEIDFRDADEFHAYIAHEKHVRLVKELLEPSCEGWWSVQAEV